MFPTLPTFHEENSVEIRAISDEQPVEWSYAEVRKSQQELGRLRQLAFILYHNRPAFVQSNLS